jgi:hypothetical protein
VTAELADEAPTNGAAFVVAHLLPLALDRPSVPVIKQLGYSRWAAGLPMPYRWVEQIPGGDDGYSAAYPTVKVYTIAATKTEALREGDITYRRMLVLVRKPQTDVVMAGGLIRNCEWCETTELPYEHPYAAESVASCVVSEYQLALPFVAIV